MPNRFFLTSPQTLGQPIVNGQNVLSTQYALSTVALTHAGVALTSNLVSVQVRRYGTVPVDASIDIEVSLDGGTNYGKFVSLTNAEINSNPGFVRTLPIKGTHVRATLTPGALAAGPNGYNVRYLD